jgi:glutaconate CoA-transferase subunit B
MDGTKRFGVRASMNTVLRPYTSEEMMTIGAARKFRDRSICFVGVGLPSAAACVARHLHSPNITLVYESGAIGSKPTTVPLSIADPELAETAEFIVSVPEIFAYWLQGGRIDIGFLGTAQVDRFGNLNTTVIGDYRSPKIRLPGAGGAPHIAANTREIVVIVRHNPKTFVPRLDFVTTPRCEGRTTVVTDLGILESEPASGELILTSRHFGISVDQIREATGWPLNVADDLCETAVPTDEELGALRFLTDRTEIGKTALPASKHNRIAAA